VVLTYEGTIDHLLTTITGRYDVVDITTHEADLEEVFLTYYQDEDQGEA
jgi:hypothetical protein